ncbi:MAG: peptidase gametolysin [Polyangiaceae bacterium]|nr:peptidase gametolysin [Polyangiaceae bacterium]
MRNVRSVWSSMFVLAACSATCLSGCSDSADVADTPSDAEGQTLQGTLRRVVISDPEHGTSRFDYFLELADGRWLRLALPAAPNFEPNSEVLVRGEPGESAFTAASVELRAGAVEDFGVQQAPLIGPSPKRVAVVLFNFANNTSQPIDAARAKELVFTGASSSNAYFKEVSYGIRSLVGAADATGDVFGWYTIDAAPSTECAYSEWGTAARTKAQAAGVNLGNYDYVVHYFPKTSSCQFSGVGQLPGKYNWINASGSQTIAHELGHNFGVHHASSYRCANGSTPVAIGGTCTANEYGDPFDVMGSGYRHLSGYHKEKLGFLEPSNIQTVSATGTFDLAPIEQKVTSVQVLRFPIAGTSDVYYVEYRQPFGFDGFRTTDPVVNGVLIRRITLPTRGVLQTKLVDNVPTTTSFTDAALGVGKTFTDTAAKVSFTLTARTATSATVQVTFDGPPPTTPTTCAAGENELNGHCYFLTTSAQTFTAARSACAARGSGWGLASVESAAENSFLSSLTGTTEYWLSGTDSAVEGTFVWASGASFWSGGPTGSAVPGAYVSWVSGEPNNTGDCMRITAGGPWRDASCTSSYRAICEK